MDPRADRSEKETQGSTYMHYINDRINANVIYIYLGFPPKVNGFNYITIKKYTHAQEHTV